jgi:hypothetical protein
MRRGPNHYRRSSERSAVGGAEAESVKVGGGGEGAAAVVVDTKVRSRYAAAIQKAREETRDATSMLMPSGRRENIFRSNRGLIVGKSGLRVDFSNALFGGPMPCGDHPVVSSFEENFIFSFQMQIHQCCFHFELTLFFSSFFFFFFFFLFLFLFFFLFFLFFFFFFFFLIFCVSLFQVVAVPIDGCRSLLNEKYIRNSFVVVRRGGCFFSDKAINAQYAGAAGNFSLFDICVILLTL